jgi:primosomal protein N' (replication factor Y) (superfamily II helicase)
VNQIVRVCIPHTGQDYYDYLLYSQPHPEIGARVRVCFGRRICIGVVVGWSETSDFINKLKPILEILDAVPLISATLLQFYEWVATYYHASLSDVLHLALPKKFREGRDIPVLAEMEKAFDLESPPILHPEQLHAVETISRTLKTYQCFMLQGVTGSGKTEVYLRVIEEVLARGQQVLVLVPEIGLTPQLVERFRSRLPYPIAVMHSHLNDTERFQTWTAGAMEQAALVLGTRSALFTPLPKLGLIVIDEEHDASFKQQDGVRYSARDCALIRARLDDVPVILGTATPSLETYYNTQMGKYQHLKLTHKALESAPLHYELVDLRSQPLIEGLAATTYLKSE